MGDKVTNCSEKAEVFTIGYEGIKIDEFLQHLKDNDIDCLVDIRDLPLSRKKGFSKNSLKENVESIGISYSHMKSLGDPKEGRLAARAGEHEKFVEIFSAHMKTDLAQEGLLELQGTVLTGRACLLCFEKNHEGCHRNIVVEELQKQLKISVRHIQI